MNFPFQSKRFSSLNTNGNTGNADWWIVMLNGSNVLSFDLATGQFIPGLVPTYQGPLLDFPEPVQLLNGSAPPSNGFTIVFGVDTEVNGQVDENLLSATGVRYYFF